MNEQTVRLESVRLPVIRQHTGDLADLAEDIAANHLRHPITLWKDGTLISGARRLRAHYLLEREEIPAVFVSNINDAAKRLLADNDDKHLALQLRWSEICRLWALLRKLDEPAAAMRMDAARRKGSELRRLTRAGQRKPGRSETRGTDHTLAVICAPFRISEATARRVEIIYQATIDASDPDRQKLAIDILADLDGGASIWSSYQRLLELRRPPLVARGPRPVTPPPSAAGKQQLAAWDKALPQLEGLTAGLIALGPVNPELAWEQVGPVHTRLMAVRRELEKIINKMRESNKS